MPPRLRKQGPAEMLRRQEVELEGRIAQQMAQLDAIENSIRREIAERARAHEAFQRVRAEFERRSRTRSEQRGCAETWQRHREVDVRALRKDYAELAGRVEGLRGELRVASDRLQCREKERAGEPEEGRSLPSVGDVPEDGSFPARTSSERASGARYDQIRERLASHTAELRRLRETLQRAWAERRRIELAVHDLEAALKREGGGGTAPGVRDDTVVSGNPKPEGTHAGDVLRGKAEKRRAQLCIVGENAEPRFVDPAAPRPGPAGEPSEGREVDDGPTEREGAPAERLEQLAAELRSVREAADREAGERRRAEHTLRRALADLHRELTQHREKRSVTVDARQFAKRREAVEMLRKEHAELSWRLGMQAAELIHRLETRATKLATVRGAVVQEAAEDGGVGSPTAAALASPTAAPSSLGPTGETAPGSDVGPQIERLASELQAVRGQLQEETTRRAQAESALWQRHAEVRRRLESGAAETHAALAARLAERVQTERALQSHCNQLTTRLDEQAGQLDMIRAAREGETAGWERTASSLESLRGELTRQVSDCLSEVRTMAAEHGSIRRQLEEHAGALRALRDGLDSEAARRAAAESSVRRVHEEHFRRLDSRIRSAAAALSGCALPEEDGTDDLPVQVDEEGGELQSVRASLLRRAVPAGTRVGRQYGDSSHATGTPRRARAVEKTTGIPRPAIRPDDARRLPPKGLARLRREIRVQANRIDGLGELLLEAELSEEHREHIRRVRASVNAIERLLAGEPPRNRSEADRHVVPFRLRERLRIILEPLRARARRKGVGLAHHVAADVPDAFEGNVCSLQHLLVNLVDNAIKRTERGEVIVSVRLAARGQADAVLVFGSSDSGRGLSAERQPSIFAALHGDRQLSARRINPSTLALAVAAWLVRSMQGRIWFESDVDQGNTFRFTLRLGLQRMAATIAPTGLPMAPQSVAACNGDGGGAIPGGGQP